MTELLGKLANHEAATDWPVIDTATGCKIGSTTQIGDPIGLLQVDTFMVVHRNPKKQTYEAADSIRTRLAPESWDTTTDASQQCLQSTSEQQIDSPQVMRGRSTSALAELAMKIMDRAFLLLVKIKSVSIEKLG